MPPPKANRADGKYFSLGGPRWGIGFGNPNHYSGLIFRFFGSGRRFQQPKYHNGITVSLSSKTTRMNGLSVALLGTRDSSGVGITVGGFLAGGRGFNGIGVGGVIGSQVKNGLAVGGLGALTENGLAVTPFGMAKVRRGMGFGSSVYIDTTRGLTLGYVYVDVVNTPCDTCPRQGGVMTGLAVSAFFHRSYAMNGVAIASYTNIRKLRGLSIGVVNYAKQAHGVQFGLLNYMGNNRRWCRWLPIVNVHFRKTPKEVGQD